MQSREKKCYSRKQMATRREMSYIFSSMRNWIKNIFILLNDFNILKMLMVRVAKIECNWKECSRTDEENTFKQKQTHTHNTLSESRKVSIRWFDILYIYINLWE